MNYVIDANGKRLGRVASEVASILQGKRSAEYEPRLPGTDRVLVKNIARIAVSGSKEATKVYHRHTGYMGHLRTRSFRDAFARSPEAVLRHAVTQMLPRNRLRTARLKRLTIER